MNADVPDPDPAPRRRVILRPSVAPPEPPAPLPPQELVFHPEAEQPGSDLDILMGYQLFLGRDPENSFVIREAKSSPVRSFIRGLLGSGEFQSAVAEPLRRAQPMPHERNGVGPSATQLGWIASRLVLDTPTAALLQAAPDWRGFWQALASLPGFPLTPAAAPVAAPAVDAEAADEGFVLITIDQPKPGEKLHPGAMVSGSGWAIAPSDVTAVSIYLDEMLLTHARYGLPRPDVARNFPHYRHVDHCGFAFSAQLPTDAVLTRGSQINIVIGTQSGLTGRRGVRIEPPAGTAEGPAAAWPIRLFVEDVRVDGEAELLVRGWALSRAGVSGVTVYLGAQALGAAQTGLARPDIAGSYGDYPEAGRSGFVFTSSLRGQQAGPAAIRVQVADQDGQLRQAIVPITIPATAPLPGQTPAAAGHATAAEPIRFSCDSAQVRPDGALLILGWALAASGLEQISVSAGGRMLGVAETGRARPDVARGFPGEPEAARSGFRFSTPPSMPKLQADDTITLRLTARDGAQRTQDFVLREAPSGSAASAPSLMRLEIDRPMLSGDSAVAPVRGALTVSGWCVAPDGVGEVIVLCDGKRLDQAYLGMRREDIARAYPECVDSLRAGFALVLPPGAIAQGRRLFTVTARSRAGEETSRSFAIEVEEADFELAGAMPRRHVSRAEIAFSNAVLAGRKCWPVFAVAVGVTGATDPDQLGVTLGSLASQIYTRFSVSLVPSDAAARRLAVRLAGAHAALAGRWHISSAKGGAKGGTTQPASDRIMVLQAGDELGSNALLELAVAQAINAGADFIYADDRRLDHAHGRTIPFFKPDWSPELLLAMDFIGRPWTVAPDVLDRAGLDLATLAGLDPYDTVLRLTEAAKTIRHLNKVLAATVEASPPSATLAALRGAARRRKIKAKPVPGPLRGVWRFQRAVPAPGVVSVIMPTAGRRDLIRRAIASLRATTPPGALEIIVMDNVPAVEKRMKAWLRKNADRVIDMPGAFNWSRFNNVGAAAATGRYFLFLNDDIEARQDGWLEALLEHAQRPEVAVVGARLLYPDGKVQHGGQYLTGTHARHAFRFCAGEDHGPFGLARAAREMAAVTGACQMVRRDVFERLGGFDEAHDVVNNDLDFCLRARAQGLSVIYTPHAELMHHELASRAGMEDSFDIARFTGAWRLDMLRGDPFHSRQLMGDADHIAPEPEPVLAIHAGPSGPDAASIRRILAVKLDHIGDYLTSLPALRDLKRAFPKAHLTLLAPPATAALARQEAAVDDVIEFVFFHARSAAGQRGVTADEYAALAAQLAPAQFDLAIDLRMQPETREVLRHTGAALLAGYDHDGAFPWLHVALEWEGDRQLEAKHAHVSDRLRSLVAAVQTACAKVAADPIGRVADPRLVPSLKRLPAGFLDRRLVCVHPGVGNPVRQWSATSYAGLIDLLAEDGLHVVLVGGGDEQAVAQDVMARVVAKDRVVSLVGTLKLQELAGVMQACSIFIGNNSGPKHLAASLGVPTVGIHSGVVDATEWAPLGVGAVALQRRVICGPCYLEFASDCPRAMACLTGIAPRDVLAACRRLLAMRPQQTSASFLQKRSKKR